MLNLSKNALTVLEKRYLRKDENGNIIETPEEMFKRVAKVIASADKLYGASEKKIEKLEEEFFEMMTNLEFLPNSPTLMNAGTKIGQLSACFVIPVEDSMEGIFDAIKYTALIHKSGGGTGFSFSRLRPKNSPVASTGGVASGVVSFMKVFDSATETVKQGGRRRGANMGVLRVDHPDILEFIQCKKDNNVLNNFNLSVAVTEEFMKAVEEGKDYDLIDPRTKKVAGKLNAKEVFDLIVEMSWRNGEPAILFIDRANKYNPVPHLGEIESCNPCGEQFLLPFESCNLGSINLSKMLVKRNEKYEFDINKLRNIVYKAVHFLDNVIDVNKYPIKQIEEMTKKTRKIGLGIMGFADVLFKLGIPYNSNKAVEMADFIMSHVNKFSKEKSIELAKIRGTFPAYKGSTWEKRNIKIRNATTTTIAPTGSISIIANTTSGIEPLFALAFYKNVLDGEKLPETYEYFREVAIERGFYSDELLERIIENKGTVQGLEEVPEDIQKIFVTAHNISPEWHVKIQSAFQKHTDNAISKTVNFRKDATKEEVREVYMLAYKLGCKGVTVYRDGSREGQVLSFNKEENNKETNKVTIKERPKVTRGFTEKVRTGCGNLYVTVNRDENGNICEVFTNLGRGGGCPSQSEATARLVSIALRAGVDIKQIIEQLKGIRCHSTLMRKGKDKSIEVLSCPDAIGRLLEKGANIKVNKEETIVQDYILTEDELATSINNENKGLCPECGAILEHESGCVICRSCGYSKCG